MESARRAPLCACGAPGRRSVRSCRRLHRIVGSQRFRKLGRTYDCLAGAAPLHCPQMEQVRPVGQREGHTHAPSGHACAGGVRRGHRVRPRDFRNALGRFATGITVVTMLAPGTLRPAGSVTKGAPSRRRTQHRNRSRPTAHVRAHGQRVHVGVVRPATGGRVSRQAGARPRHPAEAPRFGISVLAEGRGLSDRFAQQAGANRPASRSKVRWLPGGARGAHPPRALVLPGA